LVQLAGHHQYVAIIVGIVGDFPFADKSNDEVDRIIGGRPCDDTVDFF
jgi:hypothetical protein